MGRVLVRRIFRGLTMRASRCGHCIVLSSLCTVKLGLAGWLRVVTGWLHSVLVVSRSALDPVADTADRLKTLDLADRADRARAAPGAGHR